jgi:hypothetical protein
MIEISDRIVSDAMEEAMEVESDEQLSSETVQQAIADLSEAQLVRPCYVFSLCF